MYYVHSPNSLHLFYLSYRYDLIIIYNQAFAEHELHVYSDSPVFNIAKKKILNQNKVWLVADPFTNDTNPVPNAGTQTVIGHLIKPIQRQKEPPCNLQIKHS